MTSQTAWCHLDKFSISIPSLIYFSWNGFLITSHISDFAFRHAIARRNPFSQNKLMIYIFFILKKITKLMTTVNNLINVWYLHKKTPTCVGRQKHCDDVSIVIKILLINNQSLVPPSFCTLRYTNRVQLTSHPLAARKIG